MYQTTFPRKHSFVLLALSACMVLLASACLTTADSDGSGRGANRDDDDEDASIDPVDDPSADPTADPTADPSTDPVADVADPSSDPVVQDLAADDDPGDEMWLTWGTHGTDGTNAVSPEGHGYCSLDDIRTDDLANVYDTEVPADPWGSSPVADTVGRCGNDFDTTMWRLMNCERMTQDLTPLRCDLRLVYLGRLHSKDMISRSFFDHVNPDGDDPFDRMEAHGVGFTAAGENIAMYPDIEDAHMGWMDSDGHRSNILETMFSYAGIGVIRSGQYYWLSQEFIHP